MADGKLDLLDDLISSRPSDQTWIPKGNDEDKSMIGLLDLAKDQAVPDSSIPLSPQWLYAKPSDTKTLKIKQEDLFSYKRKCVHQVHCPLEERVLSNQEGLSELNVDPVVRRSPSNAAVACEVEKRDGGGNAVATGKKDLGFRQTASCGDAEVTEISFSDMLKSNAKAQEVHSSTAASDAFDAAQGARRNKKKGKKGRQIDPALLGFKVTSNRIMMGEIQRIED